MPDELSVEVLERDLAADLAGGRGKSEVENAISEGTIATIHKKNKEGCECRNGVGRRQPRGEILGINAGANGTGMSGSATTDIVNPYQAILCGCIYCFVCIATKLEAEEGEGWTCLRCGEVVKVCQPWNGDVLCKDRGTAQAKSKTVDFVSYDDRGRGREKLVEVEPRPEDDRHNNLMESSFWSTVENGSPKDASDSSLNFEKG